MKCDHDADASAPRASPSARWRSRRRAAGGGTGRGQDALTERNREAQPTAETSVVGQPAPGLSTPTVQPNHGEPGWVGNQVLGWACLDAAPSAPRAGGRGDGPRAAGAGTGRAASGGEKRVTQCGSADRPLVSAWPENEALFSRTPVAH
ncbi:MAG: hypothetical protein ABSG56_37205 [Bryobacteraceae bacterium]